VVDDLERAMVICSLPSGGAFLWGLNLGGGENGVFGGKKWSNRTLFICWGVSAPGREGKGGGVRP